MVAPSKRTRSRKKVKKKTPGARNVTHIRGEKAKKKACGRCGKQLSGVASDSSTKMKNMSKSSKVPARPYAGVLCSNCLDGLLRYVTRMEVKHSNPEYAELDFRRDLTLEKYLPRGWWSEVTAGKKKVAKAKSKPDRKAKAKAKPKTKAKAKAKSKSKAKSK